ncbi:MAG: alcohol dehydrogenase catalytic domain-containing protein [Spirochaetes bacterium]|nr:alcohol dehydrogenase catalytic domain-containing protein [Spirochaetota bacterium]
MNIPSKRKVATRGGDGIIRLIEQDMPQLKKGTVLVKVQSSLVSPGTELKGWVAFSKKRNNPDPNEKPSPFGYSNAGIIEEIGEGVTEYKKGDRVACIGWGFAQHTDYAVMPHNLCIPLPDNVSFDQGAYAMLLATAMHVVRRGQPEFGEYVCIVGLGIVGTLTARLYQLAGNYPIGWDINPFCLDTAKKFGIETAMSDAGVIEATKKFTNGSGLDAAVLANAGPCDETVNRLVDCMKLSPDGHSMGRIMIVGWPTFAYDGMIGGMNNIDIRRCSRTGFGYHDPIWEHGEDYPLVAMRWTTKTNLALCMRLIGEGKVNVDALTTHRIPLDRVEEETGKAMQTPEKMLGVIFKP